MGVSIACHHTITIASKVNSPDATVIAGHDKLTRRITVKLAIEVEVFRNFPAPIWRGRYCGIPSGWPQVATIFPTNTLCTKSTFPEKISPAKAQRRKALPRF
jgi:hypothetical protein